MRLWAWFLGALLLASVGSVASAQVYGVNTGTPGAPVITEPSREGLMDAWNDMVTWFPGPTYNAPLFGFSYTPSLTYTLNRVEWYAGGLSGLVAVEIRADDGSGFPNGAILGSVTYTESADQGWQGQNLGSPVALTAGTVYYIRYYVVINAPCSFIPGGGTVIPHYWSYDGGTTWNGPAPAFCWMARFYGDEGGTPVIEDTWSSVKSLFR